MEQLVNITNQLNSWADKLKLTLTTAFFSALDFYNQPPITFWTIKRCYASILILFLLASAHGLFGLGPRCISLESLATVAYVYIHQCFPARVAEHANFLIGTISTTTMASYLVLILQAPIERSFLITENSSVSVQNQAEMSEFRGKFRQFLLATQLPLYFGALFFCYCCVYLNGHFRLTLIVVSFWAFSFPLIVFLFIHSIYLIILYILLSSKYITIQQQSIVAILQQINQQMQSCKSKATKVSIWIRYIQVNYRLSQVARTLNAYAHYWSTNLSIILIGYMTIGCYCLYIVLLVPGLQWMEKYLFLWAVLNFEMLQLSVIHQCASIVQLNKIISKENGHFYRALAEHGLGGNSTLQIRYLLKAENLQNRRLLQKYAYRILGNYKISQNSFYLVISYTSVAFMHYIKYSYNIV